MYKLQLFTGISVTFLFNSSLWRAHWYVRFSTAVKGRRKGVKDWEGLLTFRRLRGLFPAMGEVINNTLCVSLTCCILVMVFVETRTDIFVESPLDWVYTWNNTTTALSIYDCHTCSTHKQHMTYKKNRQPVITWAICMMKLLMQSTTVTRVRSTHKQHMTHNKKNRQLVSDLCDEAIYNCHTCSTHKQHMTPQKIVSL